MPTRLHQTIAGRLYFIGSLAIAAIVALAAVTIYFAHHTRDAAEMLYSRGLVGAVEASEIELLLQKHRRVIEAAPLEFDRKLLVLDKESSEHFVAGIEPLLARADASFAKRIEAELPRLWQLGREVLSLAENFAQDSALPVVNRYVEAAERAQESIRAYRRERVQTADAEATLLVTRAGRLVWWVMAITLVAGLLIGPLAFLLLRNMILRLDRITQAMRRLAANDTSVDVAGTSDTDEVGEMARAIAVFKANAVELIDNGRRLEQVNRWLDIALNGMARGLSMFDAGQRLQVCNATYGRLYGLPPELMQPGTPFDTIIGHRRPLIARIEGRGDGTGGKAPLDLADIARSRQDVKFAQALVDGRTIEVSMRALGWGGWVALHEDVTERREAAAKITRLARQDTLTSLANRLAFREALDRATAALADGHSFALIAIDLDRFKEVNDSLGHPIGDALLTAVGARLVNTIRHDDLAARLGGDEFAVIQHGIFGQGDAEALAQRILEALHKPFQINEHQITIGCTIGVALAPTHGEDASELMRRADVALYRGKSDERGTLQFFEPEMEGRIRSRRALIADLGSAVELRQLRLHYQPIIDLAQGRVGGCEALIRWQHPVRGLVSPAEFIPIAEETGLISEIGAWALAEACRTAATWPQNCKVAVNLSIAQFNGPDLADITRRALADSGLDPKRLELEVTESLLLDEEPETLAILHRLRELGVGISLDDFGTGYSSLSHLRRFPFDKIKIDQSFVRELPQRRNCEAIVGAVAQLAESLGMRTVAEGVETADHLARVRAARCDEVQGYFFSRPVPAADIVRVMTDVDQRLTVAACAA